MRSNLRTVRIDDELWDAAKARAASEGVPLSVVIRNQLTAYVAPEPHDSGGDQ